MVGAGTITGTIIGAFVMSVLTSGLHILSVPQEWRMVVTGTILVFAVYLDIIAVVHDDLPGKEGVIEPACKTVTRSADSRTSIDSAKEI